MLCCTQCVLRQVGPVSHKHASVIDVKNNATCAEDSLGSTARNSSRLTCIYANVYAKSYFDFLLRIPVLVQLASENRRVPPYHFSNTDRKVVCGTSKNATINTDYIEPDSIDGSPSNVDAGEELEAQSSAAWLYQHVASFTTKRRNQQIAKTGSKQLLYQGTP